MSSESQATTDHDEIREWVEERDGQPAYVESIEDGESGLLRIDCPDRNGEDDEDEDLDDICWGEFVETVEENDLAGPPQDETPDGGTSYSRTFVSRET